MANGVLGRWCGAVDSGAAINALAARSAVFAGEKQSAPPLRALFAPETATATLLLWLCYFFTLLVVYMLINWLPLLLVEQGFQPSQAAGVMFALQMGAASGTLMLGALMDKLRPVTMSLLIYSGMLACCWRLERCRHLTVCCWRDLSRGCLRQVGKAFCMPWHRCFTVRRSAQQVWEQPWR